MKTNRDITYSIAKQVTEIAVAFDIKGEPRQFTNQIDPIISNAMYAREKELLARERLITIIKLGRVLDINTCLNAVAELDYEVIIKPDK